MDVHNKRIAELLGRYANLLEIDGADEFRLRAYRFAVEELEVQSTSMAALLEEGKRLEELPGIGKAIADDSKEIANRLHAVLPEASQPIIVLHVVCTDLFGLIKSARPRHKARQSATRGPGARNA